MHLFRKGLESAVRVELVDGDAGLLFYQGFMLCETHINDVAVVLQCLCNVWIHKIRIVFYAVNLSDDVVAFFQVTEYFIQTENTRACPRCHN